MLPDGEYAVGVSQLEALNLVSQLHASRDVKALLGRDFKLSKVKSELNRKAVNVISLLDFEKLLAKLDRKGNKFAQDIRDSLGGATLKQLFNKSFGKKFDSDELQEDLKERLAGKFIRRTFSDSIQDYQSLS